MIDQVEAERSKRAPAAAEPEAPTQVTLEHMQQLVDHLNSLRKNVAEALKRVEVAIQQFDARIKNLEGASAADRIVAAAIAARVEHEAALKAVEIARGIVKDAFEKLGAQDKANAAKVNEAKANEADSQASASKG